MSLFNTFYSWYLRSRMGQIEHMLNHPHEVQSLVLENLLSAAVDTDFGRKYGFSSIRTYDEFARQVPLHHYADLKPYIDRTMRGEANVLWPGETKWFAKSSGTTSDKSKFIPVTAESLDDCHFEAARDLLSVYCSRNPNTQIFSGKALVMGGSHQVNTLGSSSFYGDLSAVIMQNLPFWVHFIRTPDLSIALMDDWEEKIERMARATMNEDVTNISGVPTWTLVLMDRIMELRGESSIAAIWPNLELFVHGGVSFDPYRETFKKKIGGQGIHYLETYNASEGFFGLQYSPESSDMMLMLHYGIFIELLPMDQWHQPQPKTIPLADAKTDTQYALVISTSSGLWRYIIGDTIRFTSTDPYLFRITGRTRHFINAFGEEVIVENADFAIQKACRDTGAVMKDYTAAPVYFGLHGEEPGHQWMIEFEKPPADLTAFRDSLDANLKSVNSDYEAKRYKDMAMHSPKVIMAPPGTFHQWLSQKGKLGGQHKIPRLCNDREIMDELLGLVPH